MKRCFFSSLLILVFLSWSHPINSSCDQDEEVVKVQVFKSYEQIHPGMDLRIALRVDILGTWHINSHVPSEGYMEATNLVISSGSSFTFSEIKYPEAFTVFLEFSDKPVSVFEGEVFIVGVIPIPEDLSLGKHTIPLHFTYQACNDMTCLAPETHEEEISITIVDKETPVQKVNTEIFKKIDAASSPKLFWRTPEYPN
jgi:hypothetical protein